MNKIIIFLSMLLATNFLNAQVPQEGIVAFYPCDNNGRDEGPNAINGDTSNITGSNDRKGRVNKAMIISNGTNRIKVPLGSKLRFKKQFSISLWMNVYSGQTSPYPSILKYGNPFNTKNNYDIGFNLTGAPQGVATVSTTSETNARLYINIGPSMLNIWKHVVLTYDSVVLKLYMDTSLINTKPLTGALFIEDNDTIMTFGGWGLKGEIDDVAFYNRALTTTEILQLFKDTTSIVCSNHTASITKTSNTLKASKGANYQWYKNKILIPGATDSIFAVTTTGSYACEVKNIAGCAKLSDTLNFTINNPSKTSDIKIGATAFTIYPNPSSNFISIQTNIEYTKIDVISQDGKIVMSSNDENRTIDITNLEKGIYFVNIYGSDQILMQRFIKSE